MDDDGDETFAKITVSNVVCQVDQVPKHRMYLNRSIVVLIGLLAGLGCSQPDNHNKRSFGCELSTTMVHQVPI